MVCSLDRYWRRYLQWCTGQLPLNFSGRRILAEFGELSLTLHQHCAPDLINDTRLTIAELRGEAHASEDNQTLFHGPDEEKADLG